MYANDKIEQLEKINQELIKALDAWMIYAESNYSGDGMTALELTRPALAKAKKYPLD